MTPTGKDMTARSRERGSKAHVVPFWAWVAAIPVILADFLFTDPFRWPPWWTTR